MRINWLNSSRNEFASLEPFFSVKNRPHSGKDTSYMEANKVAKVLPL